MKTKHQFDFFNGYIGYQILKIIAPRKISENIQYVIEPDTTLEQFFGEDFFDSIKNKTVIDFGCGFGRQAVEMARKGASKVIGIDLQDRFLSVGRDLANRYSVADRCVFTSSTDELADIIISKDAFEHFADPVAMLHSMLSMLKPDGAILTTFGPTWLHPYGGHLFSVFPWAHLLFSEKALLRWRLDFKKDGATSFSEVDGGLNQLTIREFEKIVSNCSCNIEWLDTVPIKGISILKCPVLREFGTSFVRCKLTLKRNRTY